MRRVVSSYFYVLPIRFVVFLALFACIDPIAIKFERKDGLLVVDGMISNKPGPYAVRLSLANVAGTNLRPLRAVTDATVRICDDQGVCETLLEVADGLYQTQTMQAAVGTAYHLEIVTSEDVTYRSAPETLLPPGSLSTIYYEFSDYLGDGFNVFVDAAPIRSDSTSFVKMEWNGTYAVEGFPQRRTEPVLVDEGERLLRLPDYAPCTGLEFILRGTDPLDTMTIKRGDCVCCFCWVAERPSIPVVRESSYLKEQIFNNVLVTKVPIDRRTMYSKYVIWVSSQSISRNAYRFWEAIRNQKLGATDLFQPQIGSIPGNIYNETDPKAKPLGIFYAASFSDSLSLTFDKKMVPFALLPIDTLADDCRKAFKNSSNASPSWW